MIRDIGLIFGGVLTGSIAIASFFVKEKKKYIAVSSPEEVRHCKEIVPSSGS
jgi:hypothetical protein